MDKIYNMDNIHSTNNDRESISEDEEVTPPQDLEHAAEVIDITSILQFFEDEQDGIDILDVEFDNELLVSLSPEAITHLLNLFLNTYQIENEEEDEAVNSDNEGNVEHFEVIVDESGEGEPPEIGQEIEIDYEENEV